MKALGKGSVASLVKGGLDVFWVLLWIGAAGLAVGSIACAVLFAAAGAGVLPPEMIAPSGYAILLDEGEPALDWRFMAPAFSIGAAIVAGWLVIVWRMKRLFASFTSGEPFSADNARHLRVVWIALLEIEIAQWVITWIYGLIFMARDIPPGPFAEEIQPDFNLMSWAAILIVFVLAEIFREGARLKEEQALTI